MYEKFAINNNESDLIIIFLKDLRSGFSICSLTFKFHKNGEKINIDESRLKEEN